MPPSILTNTAIASLGRVVNIVAGLISTALIIQVLEPDSYGQYVFIISISTILQLGADFGLYLTLTRELGRAIHQLRSLFADILGLRLALLVGLFGLGALALRFSPQYQTLLLPYFGITLALGFQSLSQLFMGVFQAKSIVWQATVGDLVGRAAQLLMLLWVVSLPGPRPLTLVVAAFVASTLFTFIVHHWFLRQSLRLIPSFSWSRVKPIIKQSWPLGAMLVINAIYFRFDAVMLSYLRSPSEVGYYGLAYKIVESLLFFPAMLGGVMLPKISRFLHHNRPQAQALLHQAIQFIAVPAALTSLLLIAYPHFFIRLIAWSDFSQYLESVALLRILGVAVGGMFIGNIIGFTLVAAGKQKQLLLLYSLLAVANIIGNAIFIPRFGASAAAWTTNITELSAMLIAGFLLHRLLPLQPLLRFLPHLALTLLVPAISIRLIPAQAFPLLSVTITIVLFLLTAIATGLLNFHTLTLLRQREL